MIKTTLWMGMSLNGFIARENNEEDFISHECWLTWNKAAKECGCVIYGRKTYQIIEKWPSEYLDDLKNLKVMIVSKDTTLNLKPGFELVPSPEVALQKLSDYGFTQVMLTGGSKNNSSFARQNLIDEVVLFIEPVIIGKGIPVFAPDLFDLKLEFVEMTQPTRDIIQLRYTVLK